tara:strand:- start:1422 stop:1865 length:444 start_codon:yes stop_codon:yes gene_type:complete
MAVKFLNNIEVEGDTDITSGALSVGSITETTTNGAIYAANDVVAFATSDARLKKYPKNIKNALDKVDAINGVNFIWRKANEDVQKNVHSFEGRDVGVIAQEVEKVLPEVVVTRETGYKAVKYEKIVPLLIEAIKELRLEVEELKKDK